MGRRPLPIGKRKYQLSHMWDRHREILRLSIQGATASEIARELSITPVTVANTLNSELTQRHLAIMRAERDKEAVNVGQRIAKLCPQAVDALERIIDPHGPGGSTDKIRASLAVLDRSGFAPVQRVETIHATLTRAEIEVLKQRAISAGAAIPEREEALASASQEVQDIAPTQVIVEEYANAE